MVHLQIFSPECFYPNIIPHLFRLLCKTLLIPVKTLLLLFVFKFLVFVLMRFSLWSGSGGSGSKSSRGREKAPLDPHWTPGPLQGGAWERKDGTLFSSASRHQISCINTVWILRHYFCKQKKTNGFKVMQPTGKLWKTWFKNKF